MRSVSDLHSFCHHGIPCINTFQQIIAIYKIVLWHFLIYHKTSSIRSKSSILISDLWILCKITTLKSSLPDSNIMCSSGKAVIKTYILLFQECLKYRHMYKDIHTYFIWWMLYLNLNSSDAGDGIFRLWWVNIMPADALAPQVARASAGMILGV